VESLPRPVGLGWSVLDFSMPSRRQETLAVSIPYRRSQGPLNLLIDNEALTAIAPRTRPNGIKFPVQGGTVAPVAPRKPAERAWQARKHGVQGRKVHLAMETATSGLRAVEVSLTTARWAGTARPDPEG